jgi:spermidine/putrescine transport system permease protein
MLNTYGAVMIGLVYGFLPSAVLPIYASLDSIDRSLLEAAQDLGASPLRTHLRVTLPLSLPGVIAASLFVFVPSLGVYVVPALLGGGKNILIGNLIVMLYLEFRNIPFGSAVAVVLLIFVLIGIVMYMRLVRRVEEMRS